MEEERENMEKPIPKKGRIMQFIFTNKDDSNPDNYNLDGD